MKISCRWLSKYIELPADLKELIRVLTFSGIEVEGVETLATLPDSVLSAKIISADKIPGSDHLTVCSVEYGAAEPVQVVCGAPNCRAGMTVVLALVSTQLKDMLIGKAKLRGVESSGMLCSERELGISDNHAGIIELPADTPLGVTASSLYELPDTILELEITPNRPDLLGYLGIARDLSASLGKPLKLPEAKHETGNISKKFDLTLVLEAAAKCPRYTARLIDGLSVQQSPLWLKTALIKSGLRPINNVVDITNYVLLETGHPLHAFDYHKLLPLNPQDEHPAVIIRQARPDEEFLSLDSKSYELNEDDLVIADGQNPSALAGVMGGLQTAISNSTTAIVLETATFTPATIRASSFKHKLSTDSSYRFERHLSAATPVKVSDRAVELILELAGGKVINPIYDAYPSPEKPVILGLRPYRFTELIGFPLETEQIKTYLEALGCKFIQYGDWIAGQITDPSMIFCHHKEQEEAGITEFTEIDCAHALYFQIPPYRVDLTREVDLIEELARLAGFEQVPVKKTVSRIMDRHAHSIRRRVADYFVRCGFYEVLNNSFSDPALLAAMAFEPGEIDRTMMRLINPQSSNQAALRISLIPQLLANLSYNLNHGERNLKLMEQAKIYLKEGSSYQEPLRLTALLTGKIDAEHWKSKTEAINIYHVKGIMEGLWKNLQLGKPEIRSYTQPYLVSSENLSYYCNGTFCAALGRINPHAAELAGIDIPVLKQDIWMIDIDMDQLAALTRANKTVYSDLPRYPAVTRDVSFLISQTVAYSALETAILEVNTKLIQNVSIFDEYRGKQVPEGMRSISLRLEMQDSEKTLTDERVDQLIASVLKKLADTWHITMR